MQKVHHAILPGIVLGGLLVFTASFKLADMQLAVAAAEPAVVLPGGQKEAGEPNREAASSCSLPAGYAAVLQWCEWIDRYAEEQTLEANLVAALILQESGGDPRAYSHSGAVGLMQVMPRDGLAAGFQCANGPCFTGRPSMEELFEPEFNISYGTNYLASLVRRHGNIRDALMAYGPADMGYSYADKVLGIYSNLQ